MKWRGGAEEFNRYFYVADNEVHIRDDVNYANLNAGAQLLYDLASSADTYQYHAGTSGAEAADLFDAEGRDREYLIRDFEGTDRQPPTAILVGT